MPFASMNDQIEPSRRITWKTKLYDFHSWCKFISLSLNVMYMIKTFEDIYVAGSNIISPKNSNFQHRLAIEDGLQVMISCLMVFCLVIDIIVLTTKKLSVADWYWRPGVFFFTFTCGSEFISMTNVVFNTESFFSNCQQRFVSLSPSMILVSELCNLENRLNYVFTVGAFIRNITICGMYTATGYFYVLQLIQNLKRMDSPDTAMQIIPSINYHYPITQ